MDPVHDIRRAYSIPKHHWHQGTVRFPTLFSLCQFVLSVIPLLMQTTAAEEAAAPALATTEPQLQWEGMIFGEDSTSCIHKRCLDTVFRGKWVHRKGVIKVELVWKWRHRYTLFLGEMPSKLGSNLASWCYSFRYFLIYPALICWLWLTEDDCPSGT